MQGCKGEIASDAQEKAGRHVPRPIRPFAAIEPLHSCLFLSVRTRAFTPTVTSKRLLSVLKQSGLVLDEKRRLAGPVLSTPTGSSTFSQDGQWP